MCERESVRACTADLQRIEEALAFVDDAATHTQGLPLGTNDESVLVSEPAMRALVHRRIGFKGHWRAAGRCCWRAKDVRGAGILKLPSVVALFPVSVVIAREVVVVPPAHEAPTRTIRGSLRGNVGDSFLEPVAFFVLPLLFGAPRARLLLGFGVEAQRRQGLVRGAVGETVDELEPFAAQHLPVHQGHFPPQKSALETDIHQPRHGEDHLIGQRQARM